VVTCPLTPRANAGLDLTPVLIALALTPDCATPPDLDFDLDYRFPEPEWPVGVFKNITLEIARGRCEAVIDAAGAAAGCLGLAGFEFELELEGCIEDVKVRMNCGLFHKGLRS
jgi:hypothetical protein